MGECAYPDGRSEPQRNDGAVAKRTDNAGKEVLERLAEETDMLEKDEEVQAIIFDRKLDLFHDGPRMSPVGLVDVLQQPPRSKGSPPRSASEWNGDGQEERRSRSARPRWSRLLPGAPDVRPWSETRARESTTYDYEKPPPARNPMSAIQVSEDGGAEQASEHVGECVSGIEPGNSPCQLGPRIPAAH